MQPDSATGPLLQASFFSKKALEVKLLLLQTLAPALKNYTVNRPCRLTLLRAGVQELVSCKSAFSSMHTAPWDQRHKLSCSQWLYHFAPCSLIWPLQELFLLHAA